MENDFRFADDILISEDLNEHIEDLKIKSLKIGLTMNLK